MKRLPIILTTIFIVLIYTIPSSAQTIPALSAVRFLDNEPNCAGRSELLVDVVYDSDVFAYVNVETGISVSRSVNKDSPSVAVPTSGAGVVFDGLMRVIVRFGSVAGSSGYDKRTYWFDCRTGMTVSDEIRPRNDYQSVPLGFTSQIHVLNNDISELPLASPKLKTPPTSGTVVRVGDYFEYTPAPGFLGRASFVYTSCNIGGRCRDATVYLNVYELSDSLVSSVNLTSTSCDAGGNLRVGLYYAGGKSVV